MAIQPHRRYSTPNALHLIVEDAEMICERCSNHSKVMIVDDAWALFGSANWDERSLRLNFEFNVEFYSAEFCIQLMQLAKESLSDSRSLSLEQVDARPLPIKLRDGIARLFTPYM